MPVELPSIEEVANALQAAPAAAPAAPAPEIPDAPAVGSDPVVAPDVAAPVEEPAPKVEPKKDPAAARFAALSRREREIRQRETEITARAEAAEKRAKEAEELATRVRGAKRPTEAMRALGFSMEDITMDAMGGYKEKEPDPVDLKLGERLSPLEKELADTKVILTKQNQLLEEIQAERAENARRAVRSEIAATASREGHEVIQAIGDDAYTMVQNVITHFFQQNHKVLSYSEACARVEQYYTDYVSALVEKTTKIKSRFASAAATPPAKKPAAVKEQAERPSTLTQGLTQGTGATRVDLDKLSRNDAIAELAKSIKYHTN